MAVVEMRRNGTGAAMPIKSVKIELDEYGYPDWYAIMRTNPRSSVYDNLISLDDEGRWWKAFGQIVLEWNFTDEDGEPLKQPRDCQSEAELDLPHGVIAYVFKRYLEEFNAAIAIPKGSPATSEPISSTSEGSQESA